MFFPVFGIGSEGKTKNRPANAWTVFAKKLLTDNSLAPGTGFEPAT
jgi:hypothetical protein